MPDVPAETKVGRVPQEESVLLSKRGDSHCIKMKVIFTKGSLTLAMNVGANLSQE